jgi:hypothetical protein
MINRTVKGMGRTLDTLNKTQSEAGYNLKPLDEEAITIKARSGEFYIWCTLDANTDYPYVSEHLVKGTRTQRHPIISPSPNTSQSASGSLLILEEFPSSPLPSLTPSPLPSPLLSSLNISQYATGPLLISEEFPSPLPSLTPSPLLTPSTLLLSLSPSGSKLPPSLPQEETSEMDTTVQVDPSSLEPLSTNFGGTIGSGPTQVLYNNRLSFHTLLSFVLWLMRQVEAGNAFLEAYLDYGRGYTRTLLHKIFTCHPILFRVYLIVELTLISLHPTTFLLTCMLYIQEAILLASHMEPAIIA